MDQPPLNIVLQSEPEVPPPNKFRGSRKCSASDFQDSVETIFLLQPRRFGNDEIRILYISTLLSESALSWFRGLRTREDPLLDSLEAFWIGFNERFGSSFVDEEAESKLLNLTQGKKERVDEFNLRFLNSSSSVNFDDRAFRGIYMKAISPDILEHLFHLQPFPETLQEIMRASELIDSRNRQIAIRRSAFAPPSVSKTAPTAPNTFAPVRNFQNHQDNQMDVTNVETRSVDEDERQRRRRLNLCRYCGGDDHQLESCPKLSAKNEAARR